uniref:Uncharacterized protein n=1 Tax=Panagrolaimus sp. JU765 TaxID=591449 RepID=A0AC34R2V4_9BILA
MFLRLLILVLLISQATCSVKILCNKKPLAHYGVLQGTTPVVTNGNGELASGRTYTIYHQCPFTDKYADRCRVISTIKTTLNTDVTIDLGKVKSTGDYKIEC